jgi:ribonuclease HI
MKLILYTDGGARGNPGPGAIGVITVLVAEIVVIPFTLYCVC